MTKTLKESQFRYKITGPTGHETVEIIANSLEEFREARTKTWILLWGTNPPWNPTLEEIATDCN